MRVSDPEQPVSGEQCPKEPTWGRSRERPQDGLATRLPLRCAAHGACGVRERGARHTAAFLRDQAADPADLLYLRCPPAARAHVRVHACVCACEHLHSSRRSGLAPGPSDLRERQSFQPFVHFPSDRSSRSCGSEAQSLEGPPRGGRPPVHHQGAGWPVQQPGLECPEGTWHCRHLPGPHAHG